MREEYDPFPYEIDQHNPLYGKGKQQNWAVRHSKRFYLLYRCTAPYIGEGMTLVDVGAYPGSYLKIMRLFYGDRLKLIGAGLPVEASFPADLGSLGISFEPCDLDMALRTAYPNAMNLENGAADIVLCTEMIEHLYTVRQLMSEIKRVLKPGGVLYISTNNISYLPGVLRLLIGETNLDVNLESTSTLTTSDWRGHVRFYSLKQLVALMRQYNFKLISRGYHQYRSPREVFAKAAQLRWWASRLIDVFVMPLPLYRSHIFILARKAMSNVEQV